MNATHALGWALVHFVWQGAALAIVLGVALALIRPTAANRCTSNTNLWPGCSARPFPLLW